MNIVIIEDEIQTANDLRENIERARPDFEVKAVIDSVESAIAWFSNNEIPDLIFSDIQLGDGLSFEIYNRIAIKCPVIFCTAFDEYALEAFKSNGIDYLLKPITDKDLLASLRKVELLRNSVSKQPDIELLQKILRQIERKETRYKNVLLVPYRDKLIPVEVTEVRLFKLKDNLIQIFTDSKVYSLTETIDTLEKQLAPGLFYRANRQHMIAFSAVKEVMHGTERKLKVRLKLPDQEDIVIGKAKASDFLKWMADR